MSDVRLAEGRFAAGTVLAGRYELRSILGQGGMAEVYLAHDRVLHRPVAVKLLWQGLARDAKFQARFQREARAAASLTHPGIVAVHDAGSEAGTPFIVMEYVEGRSLADVLWNEGRMSPHRVAWIGEVVARALAHAHRTGIVHRDVKPGNVMLTQRGAVKVLDFGIAYAASWTPLTTVSPVHGTPEYQSPEQIQGGESDPRSDVYSLGIVLYELATGRAPFTGEAPLVIAYRHLHEPPVSPRRLNPAVPPPLESVILRCLAKDPKDRYRRAIDLADDLRAVRAGLAPAPTTRPSSIPPRADTEALPAAGWDGAALGLRPNRTASPRRWPALVLVAVVAAVLGVVSSLLLTNAMAPAAPGASPGATSPSPTPSPTPPPLLAPATLSGSAACNGFLSARVMLEWTPSTSEAVEGYEVHRATSVAGPYRLLEVVTGRVTHSYTDAGVGLDRIYWYRILSRGDGRISRDRIHTEVSTPWLCAW